MSGSAARTVSAWIYPTSNAGVGTIYCSGAVAVYQLFELDFNQTLANNIYLVGDNSDVYTGTNSVTLNAWNHVVVVYGGGSILNSTSARIYINGVDKTSNNAGAQAQTLNTANSNYKIGSRAGSSQFFPGKIDDVRIYNRALSAQEVQQLYSMGR